MKHKIATLLVSILVATAVHAADLVAGSADEGKNKSVTCGACHGSDGNSVNPQWPSLAGQHATYIVDQLQAFKDGTRSDMLMGAQAMSLSEEDMANLAVYFSQQPVAPRAVTDASLISSGQALYRGGDKERGIPACMACHGPTGAGNPAASYPALSGQYAVYVSKQLKDYASGARTSDGTTKVMQEISRELTENQIEAVSSFIQGLR